MTRFSEHDLDRSWPHAELSNLSERELTVLAFRRSAKNVMFFGIQAAVICGLIVTFPKIAIVVGWLGVAMFGIFALEPLFAFLTTIVILVAQPSGWKLLQLLISTGTAMFYIGLVGAIYLLMGK